MFRAAKIIGLAALAAMGLSAAPAQAVEYIEKGFLKLENRAETKRKICIFAKETWKLLPRKCFTLDPGDWVLWEREKPDEDFRTAFYEVRRGPDKLLKSFALKKDTVYLATSGVGGSVQSSWKPRPAPPPPEYRVKFCNTSRAEPVWLMIGMTVQQTAITEGYWKIEQGDCATVNYSERAQRVLGGDRGIKLTTMYRAFTTGENAATWGGSRDNEDPLLCVNSAKKFVIDHWEERFADGGKMRECNGENERRVRFRWGPTLDEDIQTGRINF
jgi:uncharacterized membrane protein